MSPATVDADRTGTVTGYDERAGYGTVTDADGTSWWFHCTAIADGTRRVAVGRAVRFTLLAGLLGRREATGLRAA